MIEITHKVGGCTRDLAQAHPDWQQWMDASAYGREEARKELKLANGTFFRRIAREPTHIDRLAMRALWEGFEPITAWESAK